MVLAVGDQELAVDMIIDSGADRSLLPLAVARQLGIHGELRRGEDAEGVAGRRFTTWSFGAPIQAAILIDPETEEVWETRFELHPAFSRFPVSALGRSDFFRQFSVTFEEAADPPRVTLTDPSETHFD